MEGEAMKTRWKARRRSGGHEYFDLIDRAELGRTAVEALDAYAEELPKYDDIRLPLSVAREAIKRKEGI